MTETKKFEISILGETIRLNSDESVEHMRDVSTYLEELVSRVNKSGIAPDMSNAARLLFAAVLLTDELLKSRARSDKLAQRLKESEVNRETAKKELSDFMLMFDNSRPTTAKSGVKTGVTI